MRYTTAATVGALATGAYAQSISGIGADSLGNVSTQCQQAVLGLAQSNLTQCLNVAALAPLVTNTSASIIPVLDRWMSGLCAGQPCTNATLSAAAQTLSAGCSQELAEYDVDNATVQAVFGLYPIARELVCLKTTEPFESNVTDDSPATAYNTTNGTFCVTSLLNQVESYLGEDLSVDNIYETAFEAYSGNTTALDNFTSIPPTALCQDCIFAGADIIGQAYPQIWQIPLDTANTTAASFLNQTCAAENFTVTTNGTLPATIDSVAANSTYPFKLTNQAGNFTYTPGNNTVPPPAIFPNSTNPAGVASSASAIASSASATRVSATASATGGATAAKRDVTAAKRRWIGEQ